MLKLYSENDERIKLTILEHIRLNYFALSSSYNIEVINQITKHDKTNANNTTKINDNTHSSLNNRISNGILLKKLETILSKHLLSILSCLTSPTTISYFSYLLKEILTETKDLVFYDTIIKKIIFNSNNEVSNFYNKETNTKDYHSSLDRPQFMYNFRIHFLNNLFHSLNKTHQMKKIDLLINSKLISGIKGSNNEYALSSLPNLDIILLILGFLNSIKVNKELEIYVFNSFNNNSNQIGSVKTNGVRAYIDKDINKKRQYCFTNNSYDLSVWGTTINHLTSAFGNDNNTSSQTLFNINLYLKELSNATILEKQKHQQLNLSPQSSINNEVINSSFNNKQLKDNKESKSFINNFNNFQIENINSHYHDLSNIYFPFTMIRHDLIYDFLVSTLILDETNLFICELILKILNEQLKNVYFFKNLKVEKLINAIFTISDLKKYIQKSTFIEAVFDTIITLSALFISSSSISQSVNSYMFSNENKSIIISDEIMTDKFLVFLLNGIKSLISSLKLHSTNINQNDFYFDTNNTKNKTKPVSKQEIINLDALRNANQANSSNNLLNENNANNNGQNKNVSSSLFSFTKNNNSANLSSNAITSNYTTNLNQHVELKLKNLGNEIQFFYIKKLISALSIFITNLFKSSILNPNSKNIVYSYNKKNSTVKNNFSHHINLYNTVEVIYNKEKKRFSEYIQQIYEVLQDIRRISSHSLDLTLTLLNFIHLLREYIKQLNDDNISLKFIYLTISICWSDYDQEFYKVFTDLFSIKIKEYPKLEALKLVNYISCFSSIKEFVILKSSFINYLGDNIVFYLSQNLKEVNLYAVCNNVFLSNGLKDKDSLTIREKIFLEVLKWCFNFKGWNTIDTNISKLSTSPISNKTNMNNLNISLIHNSTKNSEIFSSRDNLPLRLRYKLNESHSVYLLGHTIISVHPISEKLFEVIIRNSISNINFSIEINLDYNVSYSTQEDCFKLLNEEINKETENTNRISNAINCSDDDIISESNKTMIINNNKEVNINISPNTKYFNSDNEDENNISKNKDFQGSYTKKNSNSSVNKENTSIIGLTRERGSIFINQNNNNKIKDLNEITSYSNFSDSNKGDYINNNDQRESNSNECSFTMKEDNEVLKEDNISTKIEGNNRSDVKSNSITNNKHHTNLSRVLVQPNKKSSSTSKVSKELTINNNYSNIINSNSNKNKPFYNDYNDKKSNFRSGSICYSLLNNVIFKQVISLLTEEECVLSEVLNNKPQIQDYLLSLDNTSVYFMFNMSILFYPSKSKSIYLIILLLLLILISDSLSEKELIRYNGKVTEDYLLFLSSLGQIRDYSQVGLIETYQDNYSEEVNKKVICYQDFMNKVSFKLNT